MCTKHTGNQIVVGLAEENRCYQVKYDQLEELRLNLPFAVILERKEECLVLLSSPPRPRPGAECPGGLRPAEGASARQGAGAAAGRERPVCAQPAQSALGDEVDQNTIWLSPHSLN